MTDLVKTKNARGGNGREIDEWSVKLPAGKSARFKVILDYLGEGGAIRFRLKSDHPNFEKLNIVSGDLAALREDLNRIAADVIRREISDGWEPARQVEVRHKTRDWIGSGVRFEMSLTLEDVEHMPGERVGNRGETVVRNEHRQQVVVQRGHDDDFSDITPKSGSLLDPEVNAYLSSPLCGEDDVKVSRIVMPGRESGPDEMVVALSGFAKILADRLSPGGIAQEGFPSPDDLVGMMAEAVRSEPGNEPS